MQEVAEMQTVIGLVAAGVGSRSSRSPCARSCATA